MHGAGDKNWELPGRRCDYGRPNGVQSQTMLSDTVDYCAVHKIVAREMAIPSKLIEHVGKRMM